MHPTKDTINEPFPLAVVMPISEKAQRAWKSGTAVLTTWTFFYGLFYIDYGSHDHCFTDIQSWYRNKIDGLLGIDAQAVVKQISDASDSNNNNNRDTIVPDERNFGVGFIRNTTTQLAGEKEEMDIDDISEKKKKRFWLF